MAYTAWASVTSYAVGAIVRASTVQDFGLVFKCTTAGTSGATQPAWPTLIDGTVVDGSVTWTAISAVYEDLSVLAPNAIIELFQLHLDSTLHGSSTIYYFHNGVNAAVTGNITWNGQAYVRLPIEATGFDYSSTGTLPRPSLTVSNIGSSITALLLQVNMITAGNDLGGAKVVRIRTLKKYLDGEAGADPHAKFPDEIWYVDRKANENRAAVEFELASKFDLAGVMLPRRQIIANVCQWAYRGGECGYNGPDYYDINDNKVASSGSDVCGKRLSSCNVRFRPFTLAGTVTNGSTSMTIESYFKLNVGQPVSGLGIPPATTISAVVDATTLTLSQAATMTTLSTKTGTVSTIDATVVVSNNTGISVGQAVTGTYIPASTTVTGIASTTVTLSNRPHSIARVGTYVPTIEEYIYGSDYTGYGIRIILTGQEISIDTTGLSAGMIVFGSNGIDTTIASVGSGVIYLNGYGDLYSDQVGVQLYFLPASPGSATYTFTSNAKYTFNIPDTALPFGSFPGAGLSQ
jgi:lambda family phage minor tail protein L